MTPRQQVILRFINVFRDRNQCNPTCNELAQAFGWSSTNAAQCHLDALERHGAIMRRTTDKKSRGYIVTRQYVNEGLNS